MIDIATVFADEIEKKWSPHLPRECVFQLRLVVEQMMTMEKAINNQQALIEKLLKFAVLEGTALKELKRLQQQFAAEFGGALVNAEKIEDDDGGATN